MIKKVIDLFSSFYPAGKKILIAISTLFIVGIILGCFLPTDIKLTIINAIGEKFSTIIDNADSTLVLGVRIFINNLIVTLILFLTGIILLPAVVVFVNGIIIGVTLNFAYHLSLVSPGTFITSLIVLIPHGIFEIPAFLLSAVLGFCLIIKLIGGSRVLSSEKRRVAWITFGRCFLAVVIPLLIVAAFMEATVSNSLAMSLGRYFDHYAIDKEINLIISQDFLVENRCHAAVQSSKDINQIEISASEINSLVYEPQTEKVLKTNTHLKHNSREYTCQDGNIKIFTFYKHDLPLATAKNNQQIILSNLHYTSADFNDQIIFWQNSSSSQEFYSDIIEQDDITAIIYYNGEEPLILQNLINSYNQAF
ncbi:MAG: stage II sporulation protein M [Patescibacteria group bacterium]